MAQLTRGSCGNRSTSTLRTTFAYWERESEDIGVILRVFPLFLFLSRVVSGLSSKNILWFRTVGMQNMNLRRQARCFLWRITNMINWQKTEKSLIKWWTLFYFYQHCDTHPAADERPNVLNTDWICNPLNSPYFCNSIVDVQTAQRSKTHADPRRVSCQSAESGVDLSECGCHVRNVHIPRSGKPPVGTERRGAQRGEERGYEEMTAHRYTSRPINMKMTHLWKRERESARHQQREKNSFELVAASQKAEANFDFMNI